VVDERIGILRRHLVGPMDLSIGLLKVFDWTRSFVVSLSEPNSKAEHSQQDQNERPAGLSSFDASLVCAPVGGRDFPITCSEFVIFHFYFPFIVNDLKLMEPARDVERFTSHPFRI